MPAIAKPVQPETSRRAAFIRARRLLDEIEEMRFIKESVLDGGMSQAAVADLLGTSQASVSRLVKKVAEKPSATKPTVVEIISRATVKETTRKRMVNDLLALRIGYVKRPGSEWEAFRDAVQRGFMSKKEASPIIEAAARQLVGRVTASMDLEAQQVPDVEVAKMLAETTARLTADLG